VSKIRKPAKKSVELDPAARPSRIRRDPALSVQAADAQKKLHWRTDEREIWIAMIGVVLFALAINIVTIGFSAITSN
jgi:hypothetical protein